MDFVLTSDVDWASEYCIQHFLGVASRFGVRPTVFVTHESAILRRAARAGRVELGVHPNFRPQSTHGDTIDAVLAHVMDLAPGAFVVRSHRHLCGLRIERALAARGLRVDSNTCRHLKPGIAPAVLASGLLRLPVFFEDDCHWMQALTWRFADHAAAFFSPGLKVLNFHPFFAALNVPSAAFYRRHKPLIRTLDAGAAADLRFEGSGSGTFLVETVAAILAAGHRFVTLGELAETITRGAS